MVEEILADIRDAITKVLSNQAFSAIQSAVLNMSRKDKLAPVAKNINVQCGPIVTQFDNNLKKNFDRLTDQSISAGNSDSDNFSNLVEQTGESASAMDGMKSYCRNMIIPEYVKFTTRLNALLPDMQIDESINPLDPGLIGDAFVQALDSFQAEEEATLDIYREFNAKVFRSLSGTIAEANEILLGNSILPDLVIDSRGNITQLTSRRGERAQESALERALRTTSDEAITSRSTSIPELYGVIRKLMSGESNDSTEQATEPTEDLVVAIPTATIQARGLGGSAISEQGLIQLHIDENQQLGNSKIEILESTELLNLLNELDHSEESHIGENTMLALLGEALQSQSNEDKTVAINSYDHDALKIVQWIFDAINSDVSVIKPIKDLLLSIQLVVARTTLGDPDFFAVEEHPLRSLINEIANTGIGWSDVKMLEEDLVFSKICQVTEQLVRDFDGDSTLAVDLLTELLAAENQSAGVYGAQDTDDIETSERQDRMSEIQLAVSEKMQERIQHPLDPFIDEFLNTYFSRFLVKHATRDGLTGESWNTVIGLLDALLWSVKPGKQSSDREKFEQIKPELIKGVSNALENAEVDHVTRINLIAQLGEIQEQSFDSSAYADTTSADTGSSAVPEDARHASARNHSRQASSKSSESHNEPRKADVDSLPVGLWFEFDIDGEHKTYCTLAAKLPELDKYVFVNRQGVRLFEKSSQGLARELEHGTAKIVGGWHLFERAMESVISMLRARLSD